MKKGDYERAITDFDHAIRANPNFAFAYNGRGSAYANRREYERAIADFDAAIRIDPQYAWAFYNRGRAKQLSGDGTGGEADIATAKRSIPRIGS